MSEAAGWRARSARRAILFPLNQLPELYSGITLNPMNFPVQYLGANVPQAWAAGSVFMLLQTILGFLPDAPAGRLWVDPHLPDWLQDITVSRLRVGEHVFTIQFWREGAETRFKVLEGDHKYVEQRAFGGGVHPRSRIGAPSHRPATPPSVPPASARAGNCRPKALRVQRGHSPGGPVRP